MDLTVLVCGGGNGAHAMTALASSRVGVEVRLLSLFKDEAERFEKSMGVDGLKVTITNSPEGTPAIIAKPKLVTDDPEIAVKGAQLIIFTMPAFAHAEYFMKIAPFLDPNSVVVGMPGQFGYQFQASALLGTRGESCSILSFETMPWACRIKEFGRHVEILGTKTNISTSFNQCRRDASAFDAIEAMQRLFGKNPIISQASNYLAVNLFAQVHPMIMYGCWKNWDGRPLDKKPLFYQGVDAWSANLVDDVNKEIVATAREIQRRYPQLDMSGVIHVFDWYKRAYPNDVDDWSSLEKVLQTNKAYDGLLHPCKEIEDGKFVPDWSYRYISEDLPFGCVVIKGISELAGVPTPKLDETIAWCQNKIDKEYVIDGKLTGKDVGQSRAPQAYGFKSLENLVALASSEERPAKIARMH